MNSVLNIESSNALCGQNRREVLRRIKTSVLLAVIVFLAAAQTLHHHTKFQSFSDNFHHADTSETPPSSVQRSEKQDECLICQLQGQYSGIHIFHAPSVVFTPEIKIVRAAVFFSQTFYSSAENSSAGARGPPAPFLL